jgi:hypothetical protein
MVPPGRYQARLSTAGGVQLAAFEVRMDPRVSKEGVTVEDVTAQAELAVKVRDALASARALTARLERALKDLPAGSEKSPKIDALQKQLVTGTVRYSQPMLVEQLEYLYQYLDRADQRPGQDAYAREQELRAALERIQRQADELAPAVSAEGQAPRTLAP